MTTGGVISGIRVGSHDTYNVTAGHIVTVVSIYTVFGLVYLYS